MKKSRKIDIAVSLEPRRFAVRNSAGMLQKTPNGTVFFAAKADAKKFRNELGSGYHVSRGFDHWRGQSAGTRL